jgi:FkbM family methyltransferase
MGGLLDDDLRSEMMTDLLRKPLRQVARKLFRHYGREYGKYTILTKLFVPYLAQKNTSPEIVEVDGGLRMELDSREYIQAQLYLFGCFEPATIKFIRKAVKSGSTVLDVGGNIGYHALEFAKAAGQAGQVFTFEPDEKNITALRRNAALNNLTTITAMQTAVSDSNAPLKLYLSAVDNNAGAHSTVYNERMLSETYVEVPSVTMDAFVREKNLTRVDCVKIDIEGAEMSVLKGMTTVLNEKRPMLIIELCAEYQNLAGYTVKQFKSYLMDGFKMAAFTTNDDGRLVKSPVTAFHHLDNVVFIPIERLVEFELLVQA